MCYTRNDTNVGDIYIYHLSFSTYIYCGCTFKIYLSIYFTGNFTEVIFDSLQVMHV